MLHDWHNKSCGIGYSSPNSILSFFNNRNPFLEIWVHSFKVTCESKLWLIWHELKCDMEHLWSALQGKARSSLFCPLFCFLNMDVMARDQEANIELKGGAVCWEFWSNKIERSWARVALQWAIEALYWGPLNFFFMREKILLCMSHYLFRLSVIHSQTNSKH